MLVLSRRTGEEVFIGGDVSIRVLAIHGNRVRIGITAPRALPIYREEIIHRIGSLPKRPDSNETDANDRRESDEVVP